MIIGGQSHLEFSVSGTTFPLLALPGMQCMISVNTKQALPTLKVMINDPIAALNSSLPVVDGTQIGIILDDTSTPNPKQTTFRSFGTPKRMHMPNHSDQTLYSITGVLDSLPFIRSSPNGTYTGTSNTVVSNIASSNSFTLQSNVTGNDNMNWLPGKKTWAGYLDHIVKHAWVDSKAAMGWGVDELRNLHYHNIVPLYNKQPKAFIVFGTPSLDSANSNSKNTYIALQYRAINRSGLFNSLGGYGIRTVQPTLQGTQLNKYLGSQATVNNNSLDISSVVSGAVQPVSKMSLVAADSGNSHENYMQARHQNHRLSCSYSQNVYVMLYQRTNLTLFDTVNFTCTTENQGQTSLVNGTYLVTGITRYYWTSRYYEKLELTSNGPIANSSGGLLN